MKRKDRRTANMRKKKIRNGDISGTETNKNLKDIINAANNM